MMDAPGLCKLRGALNLIWARFRIALSQPIASLLTFAHSVVRAATHKPPVASNP